MVVSSVEESFTSNPELSVGLITAVHNFGPEANLT